MKTFINGLSLIIPTAFIFYLLVWILEKTEQYFKNILLMLIEPEAYMVGMGFFFGVVLVYVIGLLLKFWIIQKVRDLIERVIDKTPIISSLYGSVKDFLHFFSNLKSKGDHIVVLVELPNIEAKLIGFITQEVHERLDQIDMEEPVLVYLQLSYQIGGYSLFIPKKRLQAFDMGVEEAFRFVLTAGVSNGNKNSPQSTS